MVNPRKKKFGKLAADPSSAPAPSGLSSGLNQPSTSSAQPSTSIGQLSSDFGKFSFGGDEDSNEKESYKFAPKIQSGKLGKEVILKANFFKIKLERTPNFFHYNIEIIKDDGKKKENKKDSTPRSKKTPKHLNNLVFSELFKSGNRFQIRSIPVFDGEKNFYSLEKLHGLTNGTWSGVVKIKDQEKEESFRVNITTPEISHSQSLDRLIKDRKNLSISPIELQSLDIIMRNGPRLNKIQCGFNFFLKYDHPKHFEKESYFEIGRDVMKYGKFGHYQCARIVENGIYYNVDRAMQIFTHGGKLNEAIDALTNNRGLNSREIGRVEEQLKGLKFRALHLSYRRTFIINGFSRNTCNQQKFTIDENGKKETMSVYDYYYKNYPNFTKRYKLDPNQLLVQVGSKNNAKYFPIECCELENDEVYRRKLKPDLQGQVTRTSSSQLPADRFKGITKHVKTIEADSTINGFNYLSNFGIGIETEPARVKGRILNAPEVEYADEKCLDTRGNGSWDIKGHSFFKGSQIDKDWCVINIDKVNNYQNRSSIPRQKVDDLIKSLIHESRYKGVNLKQARQEVWMYNFDYRGKNTLEKSLFEKLKDMKLVFILIPSRDEIYHEIKTISEIYLRDSNIITQCLNQEKRYWQDDRLWNQLITNLFLKINPKTGGINNVIKQVSKSPFLKTKLMIIGLDVTHPSPTDGFSKSVAAVCATYTRDFDTVFNKTIVQERARKEVVNLKDIIKFLLQKFNEVNEFYPERILVYRDGIGEGDFQKILNTELKWLKEACEEVTGKDNIKTTYVMVQKRHNTRFIPDQIPPNANRANMQNIRPGTVVDSEITHHKFNEFYLCSHAGGMGTSRPTKYVVLYDENILSSDDIQTVTYQLCYLYPRCTKSSSIPPVVAYAHLLCTRGKSYVIHMDNSDGQSSIGSGSRRDELMSENQIQDFNRRIAVKPSINGRLFFI